MNSKELVNEWLQIAKDDLDSAKYLFGKPHRKPLEIICYHCQQTAEKSLKAYLCANDVDVPKTHEVESLCQLCNKINPAFADYYDYSEELEVYATQTRYPNRIDVTEYDVKQALKMAEAIFDFTSEQVQDLYQEERQEPNQGMRLI